MAKADVVASAKASFLAAQDGAAEAFGEACYDGGAIDQKASDGSFTQADIDAAVSAASDPLNAQIAALQAQDASDVQVGSDAKAALADLQSRFDALSNKEGIEAGIVAGLQQSIGALQGVLAQLSALQPAPQP